MNMFEVCLLFAVFEPTFWCFEVRTLSYFHHGSRNI